MNVVFYGGWGECVQKYSGPAAYQLRREGYVRRIACIDPRPPSGEVPFDDYFINEDLLVPLYWLQENNYFNSTTVHVISTPTRFHIPIVKQLRDGGYYRTRIASEKPLTLSLAEAHALIGFQDVYPISHQLAKGQMLKFIQECRAGLVALEEIGHFDFFLLEEVGVTRGREVDSVLFDMHWHGYEGAVVPIATTVGPQKSFCMSIDKVIAARYMGQPGEFAPAPHWTAAEVRGRIRICGRKEITYRIVAGKGLGQTDKRLVVRDQAGKEIRNILLVEEPRWQAHYRLLRELVTKAEPDMLTTLEQTVGVVELCAKSEQLAEDRGAYPFGSIPLLLGIGRHIKDPREVLPKIFCEK
jgi:hypothetical protein